MQYWPKGTPIHRPKGVKTKVSPLKRKIAYMDLLSVLCGLSKQSISIYFSRENLELSNPRAIRKWLEQRLEKYGSLTGPEKMK